MYFKIIVTKYFLNLCVTILTNAMLCFNDVFVHLVKYSVKQIVLNVLHLYFLPIVNYPLLF